MNKYITVIALGLCLAVSGFAQANQNPPQKGKRPTAGAQKAKPAAQKLDRKASKRGGNSRKAASDKKTAARKPGGKTAAGRGSKPLQTAAGRGPKPGGKTAAGRGPKPPQTAAGRGPKPGGKTAAGRGPKPGGKTGTAQKGGPRPQGLPPKVVYQLEKLFGAKANPNKSISVNAAAAVLKRLDNNKDGQLTRKELFHD